MAFTSTTSITYKTGLSAFALACGLVLAGCGGGGGGSGTSSLGNLQNEIDSNPSRQGNFNTAVGDAAGGRAKATGSTNAGITQSSNVSSGTTTDTVNVENVAFNGAPEFEIKVNDGAELVTITQSDFDYSYSPAAEDIAEYTDFVNYVRSYEGSSYEDGTYYVDFYIGMSVEADSTVTDWLAGGTWIYFPSSGNDVELGAFVDAGDPFTQGNIAGLSNEAAYLGDYFAVYTYDVDGTLEDSGWVDARIALTADFESGTRGTLTGVIDQLVEWETQNPVTGNIVLSNGNIGANNSGFFTSTGISGSITTTDNIVIPITSGTWSGQFAGNGATATEPPKAVIGTAGAVGTTTTGGNTHNINFIGGYISVKK